MLRCVHVPLPSAALASTAGGTAKLIFFIQLLCDYEYTQEVFEHSSIDDGALEHKLRMHLDIADLSCVAEARIRVGAKSQFPSHSRLRR